jgi:hypothetical protein
MKPLIAPTASICPAEAGRAPARPVLLSNQRRFAAVGFCSATSA